MEQENNPWFTVAYRGLTREERLAIAYDSKAIHMEYTNVFEERDRLQSELGSIKTGPATDEHN